MFTQIFHCLIISVFCLVTLTERVYAAGNTKKGQVTGESTMAPDARKNETKTLDEEAVLETQERERQRIELSNALEKVRLEKELAGIQADITRLMLEREKAFLQWDIEQEKRVREHKKEMAVLNQQKERLEVEVSVAQYKLEQEEQKFYTIIAKLEHRIQFIQANVEQAKAERAKHEAECQRANYIDKAPVYLKEPLRSDKSLIVSDRRIELKGCITPWKAHYITDRIQYFNNKSIDHPIFIIIESSPGGSVQAGAGIIKAMENSRAPVHVVVKSFAASMAALIATLADKSYAYPNAMILHHQPWTFTGGNVRELKEQQEFLQAWWHRLGGKVAEKMGISLKKLDQLLYEKSANGDWLEFADHAHKLKWIDCTIDGMQETGIRELPSYVSYTREQHYDGEQSGEKGTVDGIIYLPPLEAKDFYYLYNPNNLYQVVSLARRG